MAGLCAAGKVIGVDMTPEMLDKARANCRKSGYKNVEFRLGEIENLSVADGTADVVISNCVINLLPEKQRVFNEAFRVLKPNGRLMLSDMVLLKDIPENVKKSVLGYIGCVSGAEMKDEYVKLIENTGFKEVKIIGETRLSAEMIISDDIAKAIMDDLKLTKKAAEEIASSVASIKVSATKPPN